MSAIYNKETGKFDFSPYTTEGEQEADRWLVEKDRVLTGKFLTYWELKDLANFSAEEQPIEKLKLQNAKALYVIQSIDREIAQAPAQWHPRILKKLNGAKEELNLFLSNNVI